MLIANLNEEDERPLIRLCRADPTDSPCFRTIPVAPDAITSAVQSFQFNCYPPTAGLLEAKRLVQCCNKTFSDYAYVVFYKSPKWVPYSNNHQVVYSYYVRI